MTTAARSPIAATLSRATALDEFLAAEPDPSGDGWVRASDLAGPFETVLECVGRSFETGEKRVQAAFVLSDYAWRISAPAVTSFLAERRVPDLAPECVLVRFDESGRVAAPAFLSPRFAALAGDPDAADAALASDATALLRTLRDRIDEHLAVTIGALRLLSPLGVRAQWALAADACASAFLWAGQKLGDQDRAAREAEAFLAVRRSELRTRLRFLAVEHAGRREIFVCRGSCCLSFRLPAGEYCATCPHVSGEERERRLREYLGADAGTGP